VGIFLNLMSHLSSKISFCFWNLVSKNTFRIFKRLWNAEVMNTKKNRLKTNITYVWASKSVHIVFINPPMLILVHHFKEKLTFWEKFRLTNDEDRSEIQCILACVYKEKNSEIIFRN
jgi:hypothetical protein